jgi:hypothetical protein
MRTANGNRLSPSLPRLAAGLTAALLLLAAAPAVEAGRGGSPQLIASAIRSGSVDAIAAELERAEYLVCASCVDLVMPLIDHRDAKVRQVAAWWLSRRGISGTVMTSMIVRLSQPDSLAARNAAEALGEFATPRAIPALSAALSNPAYNAEARAAMARALGTIGRQAGRPALVTALSDSEAPVRASALVALRALSVQTGGSRDATPALPLLDDGDAGVRLQAVFLVGRFRAQESAPSLVRLLEGDSSDVVRKHAAWALGEMGAPSSVAGPALSRAARSDASPLVRSLSSAALTKLTR